MSTHERDIWARLRLGMQGAARGLPHMREYEDGSVEIKPDFSVRPDAVAVRLASRPTDYRSRVLPANYARPPEGWEFPNGSAQGIPGASLRLNTTRSRNVEDRRPGTGWRLPAFRLPGRPPAVPQPHPMAESVRNYALRERAARGAGPTQSPPKKRRR